MMTPSQTQQMADNAQFVVQDKAAEDKLLKQCVRFFQGG